MRGAVLATAAAAASAGALVLWFSRSTASRRGSSSNGDHRVNQTAQDGHSANTIYSTEFQSAARFVRLSGDIVAALDESQQLDLYAYFKQASVGPLMGASSRRPAVWDIAGRKKFDAWAALGSLPVPEAQAAYIAHVNALNPAWRESNLANTNGESGDGSRSEERNQSGGGGGLGPRVSRLAAIEEESVVSARAATFATANASVPSAVVSALFSAVSVGDVSTVATLLEAGADANMRNSNGDAALHLAIDGEQIEVARLLLDHGSDVNARDSEGMTPLHYAGLVANQDLVQLLLAEGADRLLTDDSGQVPDI